MKINGTDVEVADGTMLSDWLLSNDYELSKTAILLNGKVVPRAKIESTALNSSDTMEIVSFVGGG